MSYHHGDLERAALELAYITLQKSSHLDFSVRGIADELGVTARAIYRHFGDKQGLLVAVVARAFEDLSDRLDALAAADDMRPVLMECYLRFALQSALRYRLMFSLGVGALHKNAAIWQQILRLIRHCDSAWAAQHAQLDARQRRDWIVSIWGLTHGLVDLYLNGSLRAASDEQAIDFIQAQLAHALAHPPDALSQTAGEPTDSATP